MMSDFLTVMRAEAHLHELYRNPRGLKFLVERLPALSKRPSWREVVLLKFGNLLISVGTRLKKAAQPMAALSQEML